MPSTFLFGTIFQSWHSLRSRALLQRDDNPSGDATVAHSRRHVGAKQKQSFARYLRGKILLWAQRGCRSDPLLFLQDGRTMAERDGGSSFVVSPVHQLYRLHVSLNIHTSHPWHDFELRVNTESRLNIKTSCFIQTGLLKNVSSILNESNYLLVDFTG